MALTHRILVWKLDTEASAVPQKLAARLSKPLTALQVLSTDHIVQKNRQFCSELVQLNALVAGRIVRGRIGALIGLTSAGPANLAATAAAPVIYRGAVVARTTRRIGRCWYPEHSAAHRRHNVFVSPALENLPHPDVAIGKRGGKKQSTRLLKVIRGACRNTVRVTQQWIGTGLPSCPCGTQMKLESRNGG